MKMNFWQKKNLLLLFILLTSNSYAKQELASTDELYVGEAYSNAFANPIDHPKLPNVLIIGDSISIGYTLQVRKQLNGKADVFRIPTNGRHVSYGLEHLQTWLKARQWDVIHFNWGLWDICYRNPKSKTQGHRDKINGHLTTTPDRYQQTMSQIIAQLTATNAKLIWASTTPVPLFEAGRKQGDEIIYNQIAQQLMNENGIIINDLHAHALLKLPSIQKGKGDVHFTQAGYQHLAQKVAQSIELQFE